MDGDFGELGNRLLRIPNHGAGESVGKRAVFDDRIEDHTRGRDVDGVQRVCRFLCGREIEMESFRGVSMYFGGGGVYVFAETFVMPKRLAARAERRALPFDFLSFEL